MFVVLPTKAIGIATGLIMLMAIVVLAVGVVLPAVAILGLSIAIFLVKAPLQLGLLAQNAWVNILLLRRITVVVNTVVAITRVVITRVAVVLGLCLTMCQSHKTARNGNGKSSNLKLGHCISPNRRMLSGMGGVLGQ